MYRRSRRLDSLYNIPYLPRSIYPHGTFGIIYKRQSFQKSDKLMTYCVYFITSSTNHRPRSFWHWLIYESTRTSMTFCLSLAINPGRVHVLCIVGTYLSSQIF
ncbi:hypothetical protein PILCRDRAFT_563020 [Piloderma croceum F 1598]|uniref:Uncharacterized protein n=1 Tax=Piloderma croceum (strain F 1598) TaxID=765440 RepID=A0A0C3FHM8_PILCF|nr:hypothetical protein PILCRDRAFT_563020 [Piloderma croceum F 1598]